MTGRKFRALKFTLAGSVFCGLLAAVGTAAAVEEGDAAGGVLKTLTGLDGENYDVPLRTLALVTIFGVAPAIGILMTCYVKIRVVFGFLMQGLSAQQLVPNMLLSGFSLLLMGVVMFPVWKEVHQEAYLPLVKTKEIDEEQALQRAKLPVKRFMLKHILRDDLRLMLEISAQGAAEPSLPSTDSNQEPVTKPGSSASQQLEDLSFFTILPAFVLSELKTAFQMGFLLLLPFVLIDLVCGAVLPSMGMFMLPPTLVSFPLKILVFVLVDGWSLVVSQLLAAIQGGG